MNILLIEPYYSGSHKAWADGFKKHSSHEIRLLTMPGLSWKWRMLGGAVTLAGKYLSSGYSPDLILTTDMLNLNSFLGLTRRKNPSTPTAVYFHENQLCYPWKPTDRDVIKGRLHNYYFMNYVTALSADKVLFNSLYHKTAFLKEVRAFLKRFPDNNEIETLEQIKRKSSVLHLGLELKRNKTGNRLKNKTPLILWNHRWEYDKNPKDFVEVLLQLKEKNLNFKVAFLGERPRTIPDIFLKARDQLSDKIVQFGFVKNTDEYFSWLEKADILPVTSRQDFFGASVVEAVYHGCAPLLPKRLAYPELISPDTYPECYYSGKKDLLAKLEDLIKHPRSNKDLSRSVERFDWSGQIKIYDETFLNIRPRNMLDSGLGSEKDQDPSPGS